MGCIIGRKRAQVEEDGYIIKGITPEEDQFRLIDTHGLELCPFCRAKVAENDAEDVKRYNNRIRVRSENDYALALNNLGVCYAQGKYGLPEDPKKAEELFRQAYDLDDPNAAWCLFKLYQRYFPDQKERQMEYLRRGETLGSLNCMQVLVNELSGDVQNIQEYLRLYMKQARMGGYTQHLMWCYRNKFVSKDAVAETLRINRSPESVREVYVNCSSR